jgi:hypothetical protein
MKLYLVVPFAAVTLTAQAKDMPAYQPPLWQRIDQLCGQLESLRSISKKIVVDGKPRNVIQATYIEGATLTLFSAAKQK